MWILVKIIEHRGCGDERGEEKGERVFPVVLEESLIGEHEEWHEEDEDERCETEGDIGMHAEAEGETGEEEEDYFFRTESPEEKIEREGEEE